MPILPINTFIILLCQPILSLTFKYLVRKKSEPVITKSKTMAATATSVAPNFLIVDPKKGKKRDIFKYLVSNDVKSGVKFLESSQDDVKGGAAVHHRSLLLISIIVRRLLTFLETPLQFLGFIIEFILNFISQNGGFFGILKNLFRANLKIPQKGTENFLSAIGHLDGRIDLHKTTILSEKVDDSIAADVSNVKSEQGIRLELGNRYVMDLCVMAAKLVYENKTIVQNVVERQWKMHFEAFYNCWNEQQKQSNTQVFICCDKPKDANLIVVSFRGTEPFNAQDWNTDFDFSWYEIPKVGKIHIGFLEALGLGNRGDVSTFQTHLQKKQTNFLQLVGQSESIVAQWARRSAYYAVSMKLKSLLKEHKNAKFVVTGHSLGGALAILYPSILVIQEETEMLERLMNVYTFGQPRIGDVQLGNFMESHLNYPVTRYFRVVYCNDLVPRVPFDDKIFSFKHFGTCLYYDSRYFGQFMDEQPNPNFFGLTHIIPMRINALWELVRSLLIRHIHGPDYEEGWFCTLARAAGLLLPGISAHSPVDYVNSVRLGRERVAPMTSLKSFTRKM